MAKVKQEEAKRLRLDEPIILVVDHPVLGSARFTLKCLRDQTKDGDLERMLEDQYDGAGLSTTLMPHKAYLAYARRVVTKVEWIEPEPDTSEEDWQEQLPAPWLLPIGQFMQRTFIPQEEAPAIEKAESGK